LAATVAGLHMRTWLHPLPTRAHPGSASLGVSRCGLPKQKGA